MPKCHVTYEIVTPESATYGDAAERGYLSRRNTHSPMPDDCCGAAASAFAAEHAMPLRDAINLIGCLDTGSDGLTYYEADGRLDYYDSSEERRALHLPRNTTPASMRRVARILHYRS